jgi:DNA invertase Pin-like site-specific DNA recombinase
MKTHTDTRPLALGYVRVSTTEQASEGASLEAQRAAVTRTAEQLGYRLEILEEAGQSAKSTRNRPQIRAALERLNRGEAVALIALRLDRIARSTLDFASMKAAADKKGWALCFTDTAGLDPQSPSGALMLNMTAAFAQFERELISARTREGLAQRKLEGVVLGRRSQQAPNTLGQIVALRVAGKSYRAIAQELTAQQIPTATGLNIWTHTAVKRALESEAGKEVAA